MKARRDVRKVLKDLKSKKARGASRRNPTPVLAQSAMAVPRKAFGGRVGTAPTSSSVGRAKRLVSLLDARVPRTIGLPRAVGPYSVIRVSRLIQTSAPVIIFGCHQSGSSSTDRWSNFCAVGAFDPTLAINATNNAFYYASPIEKLGDVAEVCPASMTVQVMNPTPIQSASGVFAMARVNQQLNFASSTETWNDFIAQFLSYYSPRLMSGGKLSIRGVVCHSYPLDMNDYSDFRRLLSQTEGHRTIVENLAPAALAPIVFINSQTAPEPPTMSFLVTQEWRVRFDPGNPATASHMFHDVTPDSDWNVCIKTMESMGHGVHELAEDAADLGVFGAAARVAVAAAL